MAADDSDQVNNQETPQPAARPEPPLPGPFARFSRAEWIAWIRKFLNGGLCDPPVVAGSQEPFETLAGIYYGLESKNQGDLFAEAVTALFDDGSITKQNARYYRSLIELLALLRPYEAKSLLRRHLYGRSFVGLEDGMMSLHTLLLVTNSKYDLDDDFVDFIERTAKVSDDFAYLVACLRAVSVKGGGAYLDLLEIMLERMRAEKHYSLLARELGDIFYLHGTRHFCEWYSASARIVKRGETLFDSFELFEGALKKHVFRRLDLTSLGTADPHHALVAAQLHAYDRLFNAKEVVAIARLYPSVGKDAAVDALVNIWQRIKTTLKDNELPWYYTYVPNSSFRGSQGLPLLVSSGPNPNTSISEQFWEASEPVLAEIFQAVKDTVYGFPDIRRRAAAG